MIGYTENVWVKHSATGGQAEVPKDAVPQLMQSGWERMSDKEVADLNKASAAKVAADEAEMRDKAAAGALEQPAKPEPDAGKGPALKKGND